MSLVTKYFLAGKKVKCERKWGKGEAVNGSRHFHGARDERDGWWGESERLRMQQVVARCSVCADVVTCSEWICVRWWFAVLQMVTGLNKGTDERGGMSRWTTDGQQVDEGTIEEGERSERWALASASALCFSLFALGFWAFGFRAFALLLPSSSSAPSGSSLLTPHSWRSQSLVSCSFWLFFLFSSYSCCWWRVERPLFLPPARLLHRMQRQFETGQMKGRRQWQKQLHLLLLFTSCSLLYPLLCLLTLNCIRTCADVTASLSWSVALKVADAVRVVSGEC